MLTEQEIKLLARELMAARILEAQPSKERIGDIIRAEIARQAAAMYDREARAMTASDVQREIRQQLQMATQAWLSKHLTPALDQVRCDSKGLQTLIDAELEKIKTPQINLLVREETARLVRQAVGSKIGEKVAKLLELFDRVLVQAP